MPPAGWVSASSSTSAPGCPPLGRRTRLRRRSAPPARSPMWTTTRWSWPTAGALLTARPGAQPCAWLHGDVRDPDTLLERAGAVLDFTKPVAVLLLALLHFVGDDEEPAGIVARLAAALAPGSLIAITHLTGDLAPQAIADCAKAYNALFFFNDTATTEIYTLSLHDAFPL